MIDGITINLGGKDYIIPPLNFKALKNIQADIEGLSKKDEGAFVSSEKIKNIINIIYFAMLRNYPEITKEEIEDFVDVKNSKVIIETILEASGYKVVEKKEPT